MLSPLAIIFEHRLDGVTTDGVFIRRFPDYGEDHGVAEYLLLPTKVCISRSRLLVLKS